MNKNKVNYHWDLKKLPNSTICKINSTFNLLENLLLFLKTQFKIKATKILLYLFD